MRKNIVCMLAILSLVAILSSCGEKTSKATSTAILSTATTTIELEPAGGDLRISEADGMEMNYIPAGEFLMGNNDGAAYEKPEHTIYLDGFWIDRTEVTNEMFLAFLKNEGDTISEEKGVALLDSFTGGHIHKEGDEWKIDSGFENHPAVNVTWYGASYYCQSVGRELPSEAQWEKSARGSDGRLYPWGNDFSCSMGNFDDEITIDVYEVPGEPKCDGFPETAPVGSFPSGASPYGALDMAGNVWEWVNDAYNYSYDGYNDQPTIIPTVMTTDELFIAAEDGSIPEAFMDSLMEPDQYRFMRGGSWFSDETTVTTTSRDWNHVAESTYTYLGFRCALTP